MKPYVIDGGTMFKRMAITLLAGVFFTAAAMTVLYKLNEAPPGVQEQALRTCYLPQAEGEMTIYVVEGGVIKCWRWK